MTRSSGATPFIPRPMLFWAGVAITCAGVGEHIWMFFAAAPMHFELAMMPMTPVMWASMAAVAIGVVLSGYALTNRASTSTPSMSATRTATCTLAGVDRKRLIGVLSFALLVDQMKPATLAFIEPGMRAEYHLTQSQVAWLPTVALTGTVIGSLLWGRAADRIGRRATILNASLLFLGTTVCGAMPSFLGNLIMCSLMGMAAGGMLPVVYALMTESLPPRSRAVTTVLQAGLTTTGGYMAASGMAALLIPLAGWRVLWFAQLPLVLVLLALNHWIPESAAFSADRDRPTAVPVSVLLRHPYAGRTLLVSAYSLAWGLVYWGFATFLPTLLANSDRYGMSTATLLFVSSLLSIPACAVAAVLYGRWSAKGTMATYAAATAVALVGLAVIGPDGHRIAIVVAVVALLAGSSGMIALLGPYTAEIYPSLVRGTAGGVAAALSKSGGAFGPPVIAVLLSAVGGMRATSLLVALPTVAAAIAVALQGSNPRTNRMSPATVRTPEPVPVLDDVAD